MSKQYLKLIPAILISFFITQATYAVERPNADKWAAQVLKWKEKFKGGENLPVNLEERTNTIKERREKICENAQERVSGRWSKYYERRQNRVENMDKGAKTLEKRIEFYKGKNLDVTSLEADLVALKALIGEYKTEYMKFLDLLGDAKTLPCANYEGDFLPKLKAAKDQWLVVQQKATSIKDYYRETVKVHLQDLRAQLPEEED